MRDLDLAAGEQKAGRKGTGFHWGAAVFGLLSPKACFFRLTRMLFWAV